MVPDPRRMCAVAAIAAWFVPSLPASAQPRWQMVQKLEPASSTMKEYFGTWVDIDGDTLLVSARGVSPWPGETSVFVRTGATWSEQAQLPPPDAEISGDLVAPVAIDGDTAVLADFDAVHIFVRIGTSWTTQATLRPPEVFDRGFGEAIALDGDRLVVSAPFEGGDIGEMEGAVYVFVRDGSAWALEARLVASAPRATAMFGRSVAIAETTIIVGSVWDDVAGVHSGAAYVFVFDGANWEEQARLSAADAMPDDWFGYSVAIDGDTVVIGASEDDDAGNDAGSAYVFTRVGTSWNQQAELYASDPSDEDDFGYAVALDGSRAVVAARLDDEPLATNAGAAYVFERTDDTWSEVARLVPGDVTAGDAFGNDVAIAGDTFVAGMRNGPPPGAAYVYQFTTLGEDCTTAAECDLGFCVDGMCCDADCSDACTSCLEAVTGVRDGLCQPATGGTVCRPASSACDAIEYCDGTGTACPADEMSPADTVCRSGSGECDVEESCDGVSPFCPLDELLPAGVTCREVVDACDVAEACDGVSASCPDDAVASLGTLCRDAIDVCDVAETCDGVGTTCPDDAAAAAGTLCREAVDVCDVAEVCDGSDFACPADALAAAGAECRPASSDCDANEMCTGTTPTCPPDTTLPDGEPCADGQCVSGECSSPVTKPSSCSVAGAAPTPWVWLALLVLLLPRRRSPQRANRQCG